MNIRIDDGDHSPDKQETPEEEDGDDEKQEEKDESDSDYEPLRLEEEAVLGPFPEANTDVVMCETQGANGNGFIEDVSASAPEAFGKSVKQVVKVTGEKKKGWKGWVIVDINEIEAKKESEKEGSSEENGTARKSKTYKA